MTRKYRRFERWPWWRPISLLQSHPFPVALTGLLILMTAAAAYSQQPILPSGENLSGPREEWFFTFSIAENLMDSLLQIQNGTLDPRLESFPQSFPKTLQLYQMALDQYLRELPRVEVSRQMRQSWWEEFGRQQEFFWKRWQARFAPVLQQDLEALWENPHCRLLEKVIPLEGITRIALNHEFGDVDLLGTDGGNALLSSEIKVISLDHLDAQRYADGIDIRAVQTDSTLQLLTFYPATRPESVDGISVCIRLELPRGCHLEVDNAFGRLGIRGVTGGLRARNRYGDLEVRDCAGDLDLANRHGSIIVTGGRGRLWAENSFHPISISQFNGTVLATNQFADVSVSQTTGPVQIESSAGMVKVFDIGSNTTIRNHLGEVLVQKVMGDLTLDNIGSSVLIADILGKTHIENRRGEIHAQHLGGDVIISSQEGNVDLALDEIHHGLYRLNSAFGIVRLNLPSNLSALISAESRNGTIDSDFPLEITRVDSVLFAHGKLGQGLATIRLDGQHSNIYLISTGR